MDVLQEAAHAKAPPMDALRMAASLLSLGRAENPRDDAMTAIAAFPTIVGIYWRLRNGERPVPVRTDLRHAAHYLHQVFGTEPSTERARALETYLNTVCDHGLNASTFAARVIVSTHSDVISALTGAVGALKGPLHGGAPGPALDMVLEIGQARARRSRDLAQAGSGRTADGIRAPDLSGPRSESGCSRARGGAVLFERRRSLLYQLARAVETTALRLLRERKPDRRLDTNVEFYTALLLHGLGLPTDLFTPTFAVGRVLGWAAHCLEQLRDGRLVRPQSTYVGPTGLQYPQAADR